MRLKVEKLVNVYHNRALSANPDVCTILPLDGVAAGLRPAATRCVQSACAYHAGPSRAPCRDNPSRLWYDSPVSSLLHRSFGKTQSANAPMPGKDCP